VVPMRVPVISYSTLAVMLASRVFELEACLLSG